MEAGMPIVKISRAMVPEMWISWMDERHQKSKTNGSPDAERAGFLCCSFVFFAKQSGNDGASAKSEDISEGDHQREYGNSQGNTGHQVLFAGECNKKHPQPRTGLWMSDRSAKPCALSYVVSYGQNPFLSAHRVNRNGFCLFLRYFSRNKETRQESFSTASF